MLGDSSDFSASKCLLGRYDGSIYLSESAEREPLNTADDFGPGYAEPLKRLYMDGLGEYRPDKTSTTNHTRTASRL